MSIEEKVKILKKIGISISLDVFHNNEEIFTLENILTYPELFNSGELELLIINYLRVEKLKKIIGE